MQSPYRVMVVDDSAVIRGLLTKALEADPAIDVVASVQNGQLAVERVGSDDIDVVVLDIEMPVMDGLKALPLIIAAKPGVQVIMASTLTRQNADISIRALRAGAADYVAKPSSKSDINSADAFRNGLIDKVKALGAAARAKQGPAATGFTAARRNTPTYARTAQRVIAPSRGPLELRTASDTVPRAIAIGSSTGGPQALLKVLADLPGSTQPPIFITQHMPATFTTLLAEHISRGTSFACTEAQDGEPVRGGHVYLAPGDYHMELVATGASPKIKLHQGPQENFCRPAVDPMLRSLAAIYGKHLLVIILTGMGADGMKGAEVVVQRGGTVIAQDEASSVVWGMPGAVTNAGLCSAVLPLLEIAPYLRTALLRSAA